MGILVTHLISGLGKGGAETMLYQILKNKTIPDIKYKVITLGESHYYEEKIKRLGISIVEIPLRAKPIYAIKKLMKELKGTNTLCCWMYHANLIGYVTGKISRVNKIIWCIRHSDLEKKTNSRMTLLINRICARLSSKVSIITYNGEEARKTHEKVGYCKDNGVVLDNGCDCSAFYPREYAKKQFCQELQISNDSIVILSVARDHPIKDLPSFIQALSKVKETRDDVVGVMCGVGITNENTRIVGECRENHLNVGKDIFLLGPREDIDFVFAACDIYVLHSVGEAFPNTLIQAMASERICITTDVGDAKRIIGDERFVIPSKSSSMLAKKIIEVLDLNEEEKERICLMFRSRIIDHFEIKAIVKQYEERF